ncbi:MarR family winged helix-turn-helix transcriptional regulator [Arthrobacter cryoconiti]|uniref:MarR family winged helix-turn-helix transcriptional regulator n=1 Tax=Arthrobacter cryoconiti TaxID=748907 RepID=A0ABV8R5B6_9MICC|nr:MarR family transcriptional regulator [Arthrobacter cryoconiti]MCC9067936.1 MarR family transcriptional regulator [Arthrobacter cryoconiti]
MHPVDDSTDLGALFHAAFRGLRRTWSEQLAPWELTPHQWRALLTLMGRRPFDATGLEPGGDSMRLKDLAQRLRIAPRSATEVVDQLETKGLVQRDSDPTDRRATLITTTAPGCELFAAITAQRRDKSSEYFARLSAHDRTELARILEQLGE